MLLGKLSAFKWLDLLITDLFLALRMLGMGWTNLVFVVSLWQKGKSDMWISRMKQFPTAGFIRTVLFLALQKRNKVDTIIVV